MATLGGAWTGLRNNAVLQQVFLFNVAGQLIAPALAPFAQDVANTVWPAHPVMPLSPADAAEAQLRNVWPPDRAASEAQLSGVNRDRFTVLAQLAGNAPAPQELAEALRRGFINQDRYLTGVRQGRLRDEWADTIKSLAVRLPSPESALGAYLEGQIDEATARKYWAAFGGAPEHFDWMFNAQGQAPTPMQALEMANRGIIPWEGVGPNATSFQQAFLEGPWRNKWLAAFRRIGEYLPPPRTVTAMLRAGSITAQRAAELLKKQGLADDLVAAYIADASAQKTAGTKDLAQSTVTTLYHDRIITKAKATEALQSLGYDAAEAGLVLAVTDAQIAQRFLSAAVGRIHSRYVAWRIDKTEAVKALTGLEIDSASQDDLLGFWDIERTANTPTLTPSQIAKAWHVDILTQDEASTMLTERGYSKYDAWLFLSQYQGSAAANKPAK